MATRRPARTSYRCLALKRRYACPIRGESSLCAWICALCEGHATRPRSSEFFSASSVPMPGTMADWPWLMHGACLLEARTQSSSLAYFHLHLHFHFHIHTLACKVGGKESQVCVEVILWFKALSRDSKSKGSLSHTQPAETLPNSSHCVASNSKARRVSSAPSSDVGCGSPTRASLFWGPGRFTAHSSARLPETSGASAIASASAPTQKHGSRQTRSIHLVSQPMSAHSPCAQNRSVCSAVSTQKKATCFALGNDPD